MVDTVKDREQLLGDFADNEVQGITPQIQRDFVVSVLGVAGGEAQGAELFGNGIESAGGLEFTVAEGGAGRYLFMAEGDADVDSNGTVRFRIIVNGDVNSANFIRRKRMVAGAEPRNDWTLFDSHEVAEGDTVSLHVDPPGGVVVDNLTYLFMGFRVG